MIHNSSNSVQWLQLSELNIFRIQGIIFNLRGPNFMYSTVDALLCYIWCLRLRALDSQVGKAMLPCTWHDMYMEHNHFSSYVAGHQSRTSLPLYVWERERERLSVCVIILVCVSQWERVIQLVCVWERETECVCDDICVCESVWETYLTSVCLRERERVCDCVGLCESIVVS